MSESLGDQWITAILRDMQARRDSTAEALKQLPDQHSDYAEAHRNVIALLDRMIAAAE